MIIQGQDFSLAGGGTTSTATTIGLSSFKLPNGENITTTDLDGEVGQGVHEPGNDKEENISFTGVTQNADGTAVLTGVVRGLNFVTPFTGDAARAFGHGGGTTFRLSNTAPFLNSFPRKANTNTFTEVNTFEEFPLKTGDFTPTTDGQMVTKSHLDSETVKNLDLAGTRVMTGNLDMGSNDIDMGTTGKIENLPDAVDPQEPATLSQLTGSIAGAPPNANETTKGIVEIATQAEVDAGTVTGGTGATLVVTPATLETLQQRAL